MSRRAEWAAEALKALRSEWISPGEYGEAVGCATWSQQSDDLHTLEQAGIVVARQRKGRPMGQMEYTLAPQWRDA